MATSRVQARFLNARTQPAGLPQKLKPTLFNKRVFFCAPDSPRWDLQAPPKIRNPKKKPWIMFMNLDQSDQKPKKIKIKPQDAKIMFINLDQKLKNKNPRSYSLIGTE